MPIASGSAISTVFLCTLIVGVLYMAREVLIPVALAILLSFVLAPPVRFLQRWYVPRALAVVTVVLIAFAAIFSMGGLLIAQVNELASNLPSYQSTLSDKIHSVRGIAGGPGTLGRASEVLKELGKEIETPSRGAGASQPATEAGSSAKSPILVEVRQPEPTALQTFVALITPIVHPLAMTGIVIIFVIFILLQRDDLRNRLIRLAGAHDIQRTTLALDDAGYRVSRLLLAQLLLNASFGLVIGVGLWFIGVPSAPLWGMLAMALRFVPYIGALIAAVLPLIVAAAVGEGWSMVLWTAALFLIVEPIAGHVIEPVLFGHRTGLSPVAVVVAATFWTWLWGPIGLVLATPLTICLVVLGRHVDRLDFLNVMLGDQPVLKPAELVYQRLLAGDPVEGIDQAQKYLKTNLLIDYHADVLLQALRLGATDAYKGALAPERAIGIKDTVAEIVEDLDPHEDAVLKVDAESEDASTLSQLTKAEAESDPEKMNLMPPQWRDGAVLCVPGIGQLDEAVSLIVAQVLRKRGFGVRCEQAGALSVSRIFTLETEHISAVCVCYIENASVAQIGYAVRRLRRKIPQIYILIALLGDSDLVGDIDQLREASNADAIETSLKGVRDRMVSRAQTATVASPLAAEPVLELA